MDGLFLTFVVPLFSLKNFLKSSKGLFFVNRFGKLPDKIFGSDVFLRRVDF